MTALTAAVAFVLTTPAQPAPPPEPVDVLDCVAKGLKWLAEQQKEQGDWVGRGDSQPTTTTAMAGVALLMEGSTLRHGAYAQHLRKAVAWTEGLAHPDGLICADNRTDAAQPVPAHAHALLFLACAYDVDDDTARHERLGKVLEKGVTYAARAQTTRGGWGVVAARTDDTVTTVTMFQALLAVRKAGVDVPDKVIDKATGYLVASTTGPGEDDLRFVEATLGGGPRLTSGAAAALLIHDGHRPPAFARWLRNLQSIPLRPWPARASASVMSTQLHLAHVTYALGEYGYRQFDPDAKDDRLKWSAYRATVFPSIKAAQSPDGSWVETVPGPVYGSAVALVILQMENAYLPAFSR